MFDEAILGAVLGIHCWLLIVMVIDLMLMLVMMCRSTFHAPDLTNIQGLLRAGGRQSLAKLMRLLVSVWSTYAPMHQK